MHCLALYFQMEEEEHTDRKQKLAMLCKRIHRINQYFNEGNHIHSIGDDYFIINYS